jgi:hypothetical protein
MTNAMTTTTQQNEVVQWEDKKSLAQRMNRMIEVQRDVMKPDVDYGKIPGCDKPTLLKPGAELLCMTFRIGDRMALGYPMREIDQDGNITFTVIMEFYDQSTGITIGQGMGVASTAEEKYAWKRAVCQAEYDNTPDHMRRLKYYKDGGTQIQIHTNPKDVENTVAKMSKKRAKVDGCLNVLAASRVFAQDLEDLPEGLEGEDTSRSTKPRVTMPTQRAATAPTQAAAPAAGVISESQAKRLYAICKKSGANVEAVKNWLKVKMKIDGFHSIPKNSYEAICGKCEKDPGVFEQYAPGNQPSGHTTDDFLSTAMSLAKSAGYDEDSVNGLIETELGFDGLNNVPEAAQSSVIDFLTNLKETAGA